MKILNLSNNFFLAPKTTLNYQTFTFHGGEPHIKLQLENDLDPNEEIMVAQRICNSDDFMLLLLATDALRRSGYRKISALLPYFPAARQDRVMVPGEALSLKIYTQIINAHHYERVIIFDPHSDVTPSLLNNSQVVMNENFIKEVLEKINDPNICLVAPDAGAAKKVHALARQLNIHDIITCEKMRDVETGKLSGFKVHAENLENKNCLIVDDICDGGGTFMGIAKELKNKNAGQVFLAVSHGIFSDGFEKFDGVLDRIFTTDSFRNLENKNVEQIKLNELIKNLKPQFSII